MAEIKYDDLFAKDVNAKLKETQKLLDGLGKEVTELFGIIKKGQGEIIRTDQIDNLKKLTVQTDKSGQQLKQYAKEVDIVEKQQIELNNAQKIAAELFRQTGSTVTAQKAQIKALTLEYNSLNKNSETFAEEQRIIKKEIAQLNGELKKQNSALKETKTQVTAAAGSYKALDDRLKRVNGLLKTGTNLFDKNGKAVQSTARRTKALTAESLRLTTALKGIDRSVGQNFRSVGNYSIALKGLGASFVSVAASAGLFLTPVIVVGQVLAATVKNNIDYADSLADVRRTTGLSAKEVGELAKQLKGIDTRSSTKDLLAIATAAGRLNIATKDIEGFTKSIDQVVVALSDDLKTDDVEEIATSFARVADNFGELEKNNPGEAIRLVATVVNDLANNTKASADFIIEFQKRLTGLGASAITTATDVAALGATAQELGLSSEVASSAIQRFANKAAQDIDNFARLAGKSTEEFTETFENDFVEAFAQVLDGLNGNSEGFVELSQILGDVGIKQVQSLRTFTSLAGGVDKLRENLSLARKEYESGNSVAEEFRIKNENLAGAAGKVTKAFTDLTTSTGPLAKGLTGILDVIEAMITTLDNFGLVFKSIFSGLVPLTNEEVLALVELKAVGEDSGAAVKKLSDALINAPFGEATLEASEFIKQLVDLGATENDARRIFEAASDARARSIEVNKKAQTSFFLSQKLGIKTFEEFEKRFKAGTLAAEDGTKVLAAIEKLFGKTTKTVTGTAGGFTVATTELEKLIKLLESVTQTTFSGKLSDVLGIETSSEKQIREVSNFFNGIVTGVDSGLAKLDATITDDLRFLGSLVPRVDADLGATEFTFFERLADGFQANKDEILAGFFEITDIATEIFQGITDLRISNIQAEIDAVELARDADIQALEARRSATISNQALTDQELLSLNTQFDEQAAKIAKVASDKQKALELEKAEQTKKSALFTASVQGAAAIVAAFLEGGPILAAIVAAGVGAQIALIAKEPLPQFEHGTMDAPGGAAIVSEKGPELVVTPTGDLSLTPRKESIVNIPKHSQIIPADQTAELFSQARQNLHETMNAENVIRAMNAQTTDYGTVISKLGDRMENALAGQSHHITEINERGLENFLKRGKNKTKYYQNRYK